MADFDDLRSFANDDEDDDGSPELDDDFFAAAATTGGAPLFLGMTPVERMFISMFLFMNVAVLGVALLLATGRI